MRIFSKFEESFDLFPDFFRPILWTLDCKGKKCLFVEEIKIIIFIVINWF